VLGALLLLLGPYASAQETDDEDDDDIELDDDIDESDDEPAPTPPPPPPPAEEDESQEGDEEFDEEQLDEYRDPAEEQTDLLDEEEVIPVSDDTEADFRAAESRRKKLGPDEEIEGWELYLAKYPNSAYRQRIETRIEQLMDELYTADPSRAPLVTGEDALRQEIDFAHPLQLENINPRSRLELGFEWGLPNYMNFIVDYEHQFQRELSLHGGIRRRYQGWNIEVGPRWAIVKSTRTQTILSVWVDGHMTTTPVYPGVRPQIAIGKIFGDKLHASIQAGPDFELRIDAPETEFQTKIVGGANFYYAASDRVGVFLEGYANYKIVGSDGVVGGDGVPAFPTSTYRFNVASFGLKFYPGSDPMNRNMEVNFGASIPFSQQYWQFHYGSIMGQFNYYL